MKIAIVPGHWWEPACKHCSVEYISLPLASKSAVELYGADLAARARTGQLASEALAREPVDFILDNGAAGLMFVEGPGGFSELKLLHEMRDIPLVSHLTDSIVGLTQGIPWEALWQCLNSRMWIKAIADPAHAEELRRFGVPNMVALPPAAGEFQHDAEPLDKEKIQADVSFIGDSSAALFQSNEGAATAVEESFIETSLEGDAAGLSFFDLYHQANEQAAPPSPDDAPPERLLKATGYYNAKLKWSAGLCRSYRDRFVAALAREFGNRLRLVGRGWESLAGCRVAPPPRTTSEHVARFRRAGVNVCIWDGLSESTVSSQHFEITAAGGFLLCYHHTQVAEHFEIGKECETFSSQDEMIEKIRYYLAHPEQRVEIAHAGRQRTLKRHLLRHRLEAILEWRKHARQTLAKSASAESHPQAAGTADTTETGRDVIHVKESAGKLLILLNPGKFTRHYLTDMADAADRLGIPTVVYDMCQIFPLLQAHQQLDEKSFADMLRRERVAVALSCGPNGFWEWPGAARPGGGVVPFFERMNIPHIMWWTDHPQWNHEKMAIGEDVQPLLKSPNIHHFVKSEMAARELHDLLGWPNCYGLPVAENPEGLKPVKGVEPEYDVVAVIGSIPRPHPAVESFLDEDDPDFNAMMRAVADRELERLMTLFGEHGAAEVRPALERFARCWVDAKRRDSLTGSYWWFKRLEPEHGEATRWLRDNPRVYFEAIDILWQLTNWQRTFTMRYLAKHFKVGVFGADWSSVGLGKSERIEHHDQPGVYALGRVAVNLLQGNDEEGISHKAFQIAASGVPMVHNNRRGLSDCFTPGAEVGVFDTPREARDVIAELLADSDRRLSMAQAARERLCRDHTWERRLPDLLAVTGIRLHGLPTSKATSDVIASGKPAEAAEAAEAAEPAEKQQAPQPAGEFA